MSRGRNRDSDSGPGMPPPSIVATPGTVGGRPRLNGTRLDLAWFVWNIGQPREWYRTFYPYLTERHLAFMDAVIDEVLSADKKRRAGTGALVDE